MELKNKRFFKESNSYIKDSISTVIYEVCYDNPKSLDEEFCRSIEIIVKDSKLFKKGITYSVNNDTSIIQCTYDRISIISNNEPSKKMSGTVKVLNLTSQHLELELNIEVKAEKIYTYKGRRKFIITVAK